MRKIKFRGIDKVTGKKVNYQCNRCDYKNGMCILIALKLKYLK